MRPNVVRNRSPPAQLLQHVLQILRQQQRLCCGQPGRFLLAVASRQRRHAARHALPLTIQQQRGALQRKQSVGEAAESVEGLRWVGFSRGKRVGSSCCNAICAHARGSGNQKHFKSNSCNSSAWISRPTAA